jgi:hypothetical protein
MQDYIQKLKDLTAKKTGLHARVFHRAVLDAVQDGKLTKQEIDALEKQREDLGLSLNTLSHIRSNAYYAAFQTVSKNAEVTDDEWEELEQIQEYLGLTDADIAKTKKELYRLRVLSEVRQGNMPIIETPDIFLHPGEVAYWSEPVGLYVGFVGKKVSKHGLHLKLSKGVSLQMGIAQDKDERGLIKKDDGFLIITSKRVIFHGKEESFTTTYHQVLDIDCYASAVRLHRSRGSSQLFVYKVPGNQDIVGSVLFYAATVGSQIR